MAQIRIYRDDQANAVIFHPSAIGPWFLNSLQATATDAGLIDIWVIHDSPRREIATLPYTDILDRDGNPAGATAADTTNYLNAQFRASGVMGPPSITSPLTASVVRNAAFRYQITATNSPSLFMASGLPTGLVVNPTTGDIFGSTDSVGIHAVTITAVNAFGSDTDTLSLEVLAVAPGYVNTYSTRFQNSIYKQYTSFPDAPDINDSNADPWSFVLWLYVSELGEQDLMAQGTNILFRYAGLDATNTFLLEFREDNTHALIVKGGMLLPGAWYHIAITVNVAGVNVYVDGAAQAMTVVQNNLTAPVVCSGEHRMGRAAGNENRAKWLGAWVDEFTYWDKTLTVGEVITLYNGGAPFDLSTVPFYANCRIWLWMGDGDTYPTLLDHSAHGHDATMLNMTPFNIQNFTP